MIPDRETIKRQLDQLLNDIGHVNNDDEMVRRFTEEDKSVMRRTAAFIREITENQTLSLEDAMNKLGDDGGERYVEFMKVLFEFAQVVKSHQRQGKSEMKMAGKVEPGQRRITRPKGTNG